MSKDTIIVDPSRIPVSIDDLPDAGVITTLTNPRFIEVKTDGAKGSYEEHLAGRLLDKGADVNLRAHMLDLAAKWDAVAGDARDKRSTTMRGCARDLRELAGRPS